MHGSTPSVTVRYCLVLCVARRFDSEGELYFKTSTCAELDEAYGDISSRMKDLEAQLLHHTQWALPTHCEPPLGALP